MAWPVEQTFSPGFFHDGKKSGMFGGNQLAPRLRGGGVLEMQRESEVALDQRAYF